jgi:ankyrin repeat protein
MTALSGFFEAIEYGDEARVAELLMSSPELVRATDRHLKTPLHVAAEHDREAISRRLLEAGADVEAETSWAMTPLQWAANLGSRRAGRVLIAHGAAVNLWSAAGLGLLDHLDAFWDAAGHLTPDAGQKGYRQTATGEYVAQSPPSDELATVSDAFYVACRNGHTAVARTLLARGADVNVRGFFGGTALHWAAGNGHHDTVAFLLASGARTDLKDDQFHGTPASWAVEFSHPAIAALLQA